MELRTPGKSVVKKEAYYIYIYIYIFLGIKIFYYINKIGFDRKEGVREKKRKKKG